MFCPNCGQQKIASDTTYCAKCGFALRGTEELIVTGGELPSEALLHSSARKRGLKQGFFIIIAGFLLVPLVVLLSITLHVGPFFVIAAASSVLIAGLLRIAYAAMFESVEASSHNIRIESPPTAALTDAAHGGKPGAWRFSGDLEPVSVVENTTRNLTTGERDQ
ncbi:MAG TPA: zinc ribbon domain-containing protein [Pyrinomonadaceae bacterium]|jgi:hypothetical protein|nr:zinc ribbon domain-containing protein [Pyrinomonadaceae bacterium]